MFSKGVVKAEHIVVHVVEFADNGIVVIVHVVHVATGPSSDIRDDNHLVRTTTELTTTATGPAAARAGLWRRCHGRGHRGPSAPSPSAPRSGTGRRCGRSARHVHRVAARVGVQRVATAPRSVRRPAQTRENRGRPGHGGRAAAKIRDSIRATRIHVQTGEGGVRVIIIVVLFIVVIEHGRRFTGRAPIVAPRRRRPKNSSRQRHPVQACRHHRRPRYHRKDFEQTSGMCIYFQHSI